MQTVRQTRVMNYKTLQMLFAGMILVACGPTPWEGLDTSSLLLEIRIEPQEVAVDEMATIIYRVSNASAEPLTLCIGVGGSGGRRGKEGGLSSRVIVIHEGDPTCERELTFPALADVEWAATRKIHDVGPGPATFFDSVELLDPRTCDAEGVCASEPRYLRASAFYIVLPS